MLRNLAQDWHLYTPCKIPYLSASAGCTTVPTTKHCELSPYSGVSVHLGSYPYIPVYLLVWVWLCPWLYLGTSLPNPEQIRGGGHKTRHKYPDHSCFYPGR